MIFIIRNKGGQHGADSADRARDADGTDGAKTGLPGLTLPHKNTVVSRLLHSPKSRTLLSVLLALLVWQLAALLFGRYMALGSFLLATPGAALRRLLEFCGQLSFWRTVAFSFVRITGGFFSALLLGSLMAAAAGRFAWAGVLFWPYVTVIKATPVASFIILCLLLTGSENLSVIISFLMVLPVIYTNMLEGIRSTDPQLPEMAEIFRAARWRRLVYIYLPQLKPYLLSACSVALGMTWKSGIAAEVIGIPEGSVGEMLYEAKIYLNARDLFAWTAAVILISISFEKLFMAVLRKGYALPEGLGGYGGVAGEGRSRLPAAAAGAAAVAAMTTAAAQTPVVQAQTPAAEAAVDIRVRGLSKAFGDKQVLCRFSAVFPGGQCTCIMGESGSGKTTLLNILMGLLPADTGCIEVAPGLAEAETATRMQTAAGTGAEAETAEMAETTETTETTEAAEAAEAAEAQPQTETGFSGGLKGLALSAVFQEDRLCGDFNAIANVRFACGKKTPPALIAAHLSALGLGDSLSLPVRALSGGMRRRVAIVRAVMAPSQVLFLDEPFKGLDAQNKKTAAVYIRRHTEGKTLLMVTHSRGEAELMGGCLLMLPETRE